MRQRRLKNEINVVPYIDVMLVLLVIFMVATPMMTTGSVELPSSGTAPQKPDKYLKVQIKPDGALSIFDITGNETQIAGKKELRNKLTSLQGNDKSVPVLIAGDENTIYKNVMEVMDEVKKTGFQRVALETVSK